MPVYELLCIASHNPATHTDLTQLVRTISSTVLRSGGVVRDVRNLGTRVLPNRMRRHQQYYNVGDHFTILFDTSPPVLSALNEQLRVDPSVIRWTMIKKGSTIKDLLPKREFTLESKIDVDGNDRKDGDSKYGSMNYFGGL